MLQAGKRKIVKLHSDRSILSELNGRVLAVENGYFLDYWTNVG
jgi:hypothetical protein